MIVTIPYTISSRRISDMFTTAIEGNDMTRAWCDGIFLKEGKPHENDEPGMVWYARPTLFDDEALRLEVHEEDCDNKGNPKPKVHIISLQEIKDGFKRMAEQHPRHFADFMNDNEDAETADVWLQCVALKEVIYG